MQALADAVANDADLFGLRRDRREPGQQPEKSNATQAHGSPSGTVFEDEITLWLTGCEGRSKAPRTAVPGFQSQR